MTSEAFPESYDNLQGLEFLVEHAYVPFAEIERAIPWPNTLMRNENDAEHSFSLALIGTILASRLGLDPGKVTVYATVHDFVERYAGDTSVWDEEGQATKEQREAAALELVQQNYPPAFAQLIEDYDNLVDDESKFVYALDKILPTIIIAIDGGRFWRVNNISYDMFVKRQNEVAAQKVAVCPQVAEWHRELLQEIANKRDLLFA